tara:strand:+ start:112 stop:474 length:363 start_codon:yes stop_codon:yes gene_type:complete
MSKKAFTFISRTAPYGSNRPKMSLDAALATAVFEQEVNYLFMDDGVYQLLANQNGEPIQAKTLGNALETLDLYGIDEVCVDYESLQKRNLEADDLTIPVTLLDATQMRALINQSDFVINL